jgi:hypothetical protein
MSLGLVRTAAFFPRLLRELEDEAAREPKPLLVTGPPSVAHRLAAELARGGDSGLVRVLPASGLEAGDLSTGAALVHVLSGRVTPTDERVLGQARRAGLHTVCLVLEPETVDVHLLSIVKARDIVSATAVDPGALEVVARRIATGLEDGWLLARRLPALRRPVGRELPFRSARAGVAFAAAHTGAWQESFTGDVRLGLQVAGGHGGGPDRQGALVAGALAGVAAAARFAVARRGGSRLGELAMAFALTWAAGRLAAAFFERGAGPGPDG